MSADSSTKPPRILSRRTETLFFVIYCLCFTVASALHVLDVVTNGLTLNTTGPAPGASMPLVWSALSKAFTVLNPLTLVLLLVRRQAGIALMVGITTTTLVMHISLMVQWWLQAQFFYFQWLPLNATFGAFQLVTAPMMWRAAAARSAPAASPSLAQ
ncbi:hypothetical protein NR798_29705 [Archangium gephyra]|uniref:hypothetical protein n=1 Tax=Archangium gephyra TaxID=48 RepID=UPI0035D4D60D